MTYDYEGDTLNTDHYEKEIARPRMLRTGIGFASKKFK